MLIAELYIFGLQLFTLLKKSRNIAGHVLLQIIAMSAAILYIDSRLGFKGWSVNIAIPIILIVANITMLILTIVSYKRYIKYAICQLIIVIMSLASMFIITKDLKEVQILSQLAIVISVLNLVITLMLSYKDLKEAIIRKIHM